MKQFEYLLKIVADSLRSTAKGLEAMADLVDTSTEANLQKTMNTTKPASAKASKTKKAAAPKKTSAAKAKVSKPKKTTPKKTSKGPTAVDQVFELICEKAEGTDRTELMEKTGFTAKKIDYTVYKLKKADKITSPSKGIYQKK